MKKFQEVLSILTIVSFIISACRTQALSVQTEEQSVQKSVSYELVLGKPMTDKAVIDFIINNNCSPIDQFQLCKEVGVALWADANQVLEMVYLYAGGEAGFRRYRGDLPLGLTFYDPMWRVQQKLRNSKLNDSLPWDGLPDEASSPDHIHYWAVYTKIGMTIIYNSPSPDEDAYIYAILVSK